MCKVDYYLISRRIGVRFGEIEGDRIDIRPEIQGDRTVQDSKITSTNKSESLLLLHYSLSCYSFLSLSLSLPHITPNRLSIAAAATTAPASASRQAKGQNIISYQQ